MRVLLDTNCANVRGVSPDLNIIERWGTEGRIDLRVAVAFEREARQWRGPRGASAQERSATSRIRSTDACCLRLDVTMPAPDSTLTSAATMPATISAWVNSWRNRAELLVTGLEFDV